MGIQVEGCSCQSGGLERHKRLWGQAGRGEGKHAVHSPVRVIE